MRKKNKNKVSIVFTARNDNYGGDLIDRINALLKVLFFLTNKHKSNFELVIVEYNPPENQKKLYEVLRLEKSPHLTIKFIEFPAQYHNKFENSDKVKLFEYIGKNIGIRRAKGDFIVSTNQDIIFSDAFIKYLTSTELDEIKFYRTNRIDVHLNYGIFRRGAQEILEYCRKNHYLIKHIGGDRFVKIFSFQTAASFFKNTAYFFVTMLKSFVPGRQPEMKMRKHNLHTFAAGDFLMMHKSAWKKVRGYLETKKGNDYLDSLILFNANAIGLKQEIITHEIYHIDHLMSKFGRPSIRPEHFVKISNNILLTGKPYLNKGVRWGWGEKKLPQLIK